MTVNITNFDLLNILKGENFKFVKNFEISPLSDKVLGLWGDHFFLNVITDSRSYEFFLKTVPRHEKRLEIITQTGFFEREIEIYKTFIAKLSPLSTLNWAVKCLIVKNGNFIVLEKLNDFKIVEFLPMLLDLDHYVVSKLYRNKGFKY